MVEQEYHEMFLLSVRPSGSEEWFCPECGRRFLMHWPPAFSKVVLDEGDQMAIHSGGKASGNSDIIQSKDAFGPLPVEGEDELPQPYVEWLEKVDFESLWERDTHK